MFPLLVHARDRTRGHDLKLCQSRFKLDVRNISSLKGLSSPGTGCPGKWLSQVFKRRVDLLLRDTAQWWTW